MKTLLTLFGLLLVTSIVCAKSPITLPEVEGRFVRIEIPDKSSALILAEVEVYDTKGKNIAFSKQATQSSDLGSRCAARAVDGSRDGDMRNDSCTHTKGEKHPWWEVDIGKSKSIEKVVIYNASGRPQRLEGFTLSILNERRQVVYLSLIHI